MDEINNPFAPGAGSSPPELAGREGIIDGARIALGRRKAGSSAQSQILLGLRGVGKTVLLTKIEQIAQDQNYDTALIEAPEREKFLSSLAAQMRAALKRFSGYEAARDWARRGGGALQKFASMFKIAIGEIEFGVHAPSDGADTGDLDADITELFTLIGKAAQAAGRGWALLIDEVQYLKEEELAALIVAMHRINQRELPVILFAAGLPQIARIAGDAKSYAERLFAYPPVAALDQAAAKRAVRNPIEKRGERINDDALQRIVEVTLGYPFFLQVWAHHAWNIAESSPITLTDVARATAAAQKSLDTGFFRVRLERLTPAEVDYVNAMARLGEGPYSSTDIAAQLSRKTTALAPRRAKIIRKGMIYAVEHGFMDFTVPMFDDYLRRRMAGEI